MKLLNKLTIKNLKLNKKRTIVTIIGITLSVSLMVAVSSIYSSLIYSGIKFEIYERGDFHVAYLDVPVNDLTIFKNNRLIKDIYLTKNIGYANLKESKNKDKPYIFIKAFTNKALNNLSVKLKEGRLPKNDNEILIPTHLKTNGRVNLKVNDKITLEVGKRVSENNQELNQNDSYLSNGQEKIIDTYKKTFKIVGLIERPANNIESYESPGYTFITYASSNDIKDKVDVYAKYNKKGVKNNYSVTASILKIDEEIYKKSQTESNFSKKELEKINAELAKAKYKNISNEYLLLLETNPIFSEGMGELGYAVVVVLIIIVVTSIFCIKNSFDISITEKIKQYGMFRSIGATKKQIRRNVFYEASILGLIGIPLGLIFGLLATFILVIVCNHFLGEALTDGLKLYFSFSVVSIILSIILGIITIYFSAFKSARKASKVSPIDSIRNSANIKIKTKQLKSFKFIKKIFGVGGDISYKNLKRNKKKYRTTVISIILSVAIFIALSTFMDLAFKSIKADIITYDYNISMQVFDKDVHSKALETINLDGVKNYSVIKSNSLTINKPKFSKNYLKISKENNLEIDNDIFLVAVSEKEYQSFIKNLGFDYNEIKDKGILYDTMNLNYYSKKDKKNKEYYTRKYDYQKGDFIEGNVSGSETKFSIEIAKVVDKEPFIGDDLRNILIVSNSLFEKYVSSERMEIYYDAKDASKLQDDIDDIMKDTEFYVNNIEENAKIMNNLFTLIGIFLYGFIIVISLIGITNIFNTITTSMELRKQEFAMLKSIGMTKAEFNKMIRLESIFMGVKSLLFGITIGCILSYLLYKILVVPGKMFTFPTVAILISIIVVFLLITIIMKYSINKINKQNTIETIRCENI